MTTARVVVVGASSQIGVALLPLLARHGIEYVRVGRMPDPKTGTHSFDPEGQNFDVPLGYADAVISLAPLPIIDVVLSMAEVLRASRVIAFGSASRFSKVGSTSALERDFVFQQEQAEKLLLERAAAGRVDWTLFRPTMIYGAGMDQNVEFIRRLIQRFGFFPVPRGARGLRQPSHVEDLAKACLAAVDNRAAFCKAYFLGGGERLEYGEMVRRIFDSEGRRARIPGVPRWFCNLGLGVLRRLSGSSFLRREMIDRMYEDLVVDNAHAETDFGYQPGPFRPRLLLR